jgi:hypothetical protein
MRRILVLFLLCCSLNWPLSAQLSLLDIKITYNASELPFENVLKDISNKYNIQFFYSSSKIPVNQLISINIENQNLAVFLNKIQLLTSVNYLVSGTKIILFTDNDNYPRKKNYSFYGFVEDSLNGEKLIGANIIVKNHTRGAVSNVYGYYSLNLSEGEYTIQCSSVGYETVESQIKLGESVLLNFKLKQELQMLKEIKVSGLGLDKISSISSSCDEVPVKMIQNYPALLGENDPIQFLKMLPGIQSSSEVSNGLYVRGSPPSQTTFLLDDAPLYNISHISALFSSINPDAIKDLKIYKSHFPAKYGGVLGSVIDLRLRDGNNQNFSVTGGIGTIAGRLTVEGPIIKNKASFIVSARRSYIDKIIGLFSNSNSSEIDKLYFFDLNCKINYTLNTRNRIFLSGYLSEDDVKSNSEGTDWENMMVSFRWNHVYSSKLFSNLTLTGSRYLHEFAAINPSLYTTRTNLRNYTLKYDFSYYPKEKVQIDFGLGSNYQIILPLRINVIDSSTIISPFDLGVSERSTYNAYVESAIDLTSNLAIETGTRLNYILNYSNDLGKSKLYSEPFFMARYIITRLFSVKAGYSRNWQFHHSKTMFSLLLPFERVVFSNNVIKPQFSDNYTMGLYYRSPNNQFEISLETYYKKLYNQCRLSMTSDFLYWQMFEDSVITGKSKAYGIEFSLRRNIGKFTGMINYTFSKVLKKDNGLFNNQIYEPYYDRPHNLTIYLNYKFSERFNIMASWVLMSGYLYNMPIGKYEINGISIPMYDSESLNILRMPAYHHLDLGLQYKFKSKGRYKHSICLSLYNVYFHENLLYYTYRDVYNEDLSISEPGNYQNKKFNTVGYYIFQFVPAFSYEFKF